MRILAIDPGTRTGWAWLDTDGGGPEHGTVAFALERGESAGMRFLKFRAWLHGAMAEGKPDLVIYERAHHRGGAATEVCVGMTTRIQEEAERMGAEYVAVHTASLKKHATGSGRAGKAEMISAARERWGVEPIDDNEADALCLLAFAVEKWKEEES